MFLQHFYGAYSPFRIRNMLSSRSGIYDSHIHLVHTIRKCLFLAFAYIPYIFILIALAKSASPVFDF